MSDESTPSSEPTEGVPATEAQEAAATPDASAAAAPPTTATVASDMPSVLDLGPRFADFIERLERPVVFFDIEATGTDPQSERIVELSIVRVGPPPMWIEPARTWRVNPQTRIPVEATEVHGIVNEDLSEAPTFAEIAREVAELFRGADLAGFSIHRFDIRILAAEFLRAGIDLELGTRRVIDCQVIYHQREPRHLSAALKFYRGRELDGAHGAQADTVATLEVFAGQLERYPDLPGRVEALHAESSSQGDAYCDSSRRFAWRDNEPVFNFGRLRGKALRWVAADPEERKYLRWFLEGTFEDDAKAIVREAMVGHIRRRPGHETARA